MKRNHKISNSSTKKKQKVVDKEEEEIESSTLRNDDLQNQKKAMIRLVDSDNDASSSDNDDATNDNTTDSADEREALKNFPMDGRYHNKQRCLILSSRGITSRHRHLLEDLRTLLPHHKKESKLDVAKNDTAGIGKAITDLCELRNCNTALFLECRKKRDAYLWISRVPGNTGSGGTTTNMVSSVGPSVKFLMENIHTMDELRLTGNCMKGSRPLLTFDSSFTKKDELKLIKCLLTDVFGTPRGHPKSKPFVDRVMGFYYADEKIWVRNFQIREERSMNAKEAKIEKKLHNESNKTSLIEIGPRFVLTPIRIFRGSFGGQTLYYNQNFTSPNSMRSMKAKDKGGSYIQRKKGQLERKRRQDEIIVPEDPLDSVFA